MQNEIEKVIKLTGAAEEQIEFRDDGYWSRAYVVNGGEFVVKFPKYDTVSYENEAKFLSLLSAITVPVNTQKLMWLAEDNRCLAIFGVKGTPLSKMENFTIRQKQSIGKQIGAFLKQLHSLEVDFRKQRRRHIYRQDLQSTGMADSGTDESASLNTIWAFDLSREFLRLKLF